MKNKLTKTLTKQSHPTHDRGYWTWRSRTCKICKKKFATKAILMTHVANEHMSKLPQAPDYNQFSPVTVRESTVQDRLSAMESEAQHSRIHAMRAALNAIYALAEAFR